MENPVRRFLDLSTAHLTPATREYLERNNASPTTYPHPHGYGWFIHVPEDPALDPEPDEIPADLQTALALARTLDCDYLLFDRDALVIETLARYKE